MAKYRYQPILIDAFCWDNTAESIKLMERICPGLWERSQVSYKGTITFDTEQGPTPYPVGTMIIKDAQGYVYGCAPDLFCAMYEYAGDEA